VNHGWNGDQGGDSGRPAVTCQYETLAVPVFLLTGGEPPRPQVRCLRPGAEELSPGRVDCAAVPIAAGE